MTDALLSVGDRTTLANGLPARIIATDAKGGQPIVALVELDGEEWPWKFNADGRRYPVGVSRSDLVPDLRTTLDAGAALIDMRGV